jgi:hypothetical protein
VRRGVNRLIFMGDPVASRVGEPVSRSFAVWYVRIRPAEPQVAEKASNLNFELRTANFELRNLAVLPQVRSLKF